MAFPAGTLRYRYEIQQPSVTSTTDAGEPVTTWSTVTTVWGGRKPDNTIPGEAMQADRAVQVDTELVPMRYRAGMSSDKRLLCLRDSTTLSAGVNDSTTTLSITAALNFAGDSIDYVKVDSEIMRVTTGTTSLTVERGALGTTAASHSSGATATRVQCDQIVGIARADELADELTLRVRRNG